MANINKEDLTDHNIKEPIIRTMENDLHSLKSGVSPKEILKNLPKVPVNLPVDFSEIPSAPVQSGAKPPEPPVSSGAPASILVARFDSSESRRESRRATPSSPDTSLGGRLNRGENLSEPIKPQKEIGVSDIKAEKPAFSPRAYIKPTEVEILPPEARLAVQSSITYFGTEKKSIDNSLPPNIYSSNGSYKISDQKKNGKSFGLGKTAKYVLAIIAVAVVSYGIYYFVNLKDNFPIVAEEQISELFIPGINQNIFTIYQTGSDFNMVSSIKEYFRDINNDATFGVSRLVIKIKNDNEAKVLNIDDLENLLGMSFPFPVLNSLNKDYNLIVFNFPQKNYLRLGMVFKINDSNALLEQLSAWEPSILRDTEPLFLGIPVLNNPAAGFGSNNYKEASLRYLPMGSADAALNYGMDKNKKFLFLATSKEDMFYLIDNVSQ